MPDAPRKPDKLSIVVYSGAYERVHYALATASAALAVDIQVTLFFTMDACAALSADNQAAPGWAALATERGGFDAMARDADYKRQGVASLEELIGVCVDLGCAFMVCEMGLRAAHLQDRPLRGDVPVAPGGLATFLNDASCDGQMLLV